MSTALLEQMDGVPLLYLCCRKCTGLFVSEEMFSAHTHCCSGDPYLSNTEYFACHREKYFSFYFDLWKTLRQKSDLHKDNVNDVDDSSYSPQNRQTESLSLSSTSPEKLFPRDLCRDIKQITKCKEENGFHTDIDNNEESCNSMNKNKLQNTVNSSAEAFPLAKPHSCSSTDGRVSSNENIFCGDSVNATNFNNNNLKVNHEDASLMLDGEMDISNGNNNHAEEGNEILLDSEEIIYTMHHDNESKQSRFQHGYNEVVSPTDMAEQCFKTSVDGCDMYSCNLCGYKTKHVGFMHRHLSAHDNGKVFKCDVCTFSCFLKSRLLVHKQSHREEMLVCDICSATFRHKSTMKRHIEIKHKGESKYICNICGYLATSNSGLIDHIRTHTGHLLQCDIDGCSFQTAYKRSLVLHREKHQGIQRYVCDACGYRTSESGSLQKHLSIHQGKKLFKCPHCNYRAVAHHDVVKHARAKHLRQKNYCCNKCDFSTSYTNSLTNHLMAHAGIKPFKCSLCTYQSNMATKVTRHMQQRHPSEECEVIKLDIPFEYNVKDFVRKTHLSSSEVQVIKLSEKDIVNEQEMTPPHPDTHHNSNTPNPDPNPSPDPNLSLNPDPNPPPDPNLNPGHNSDPTLHSDPNPQSDSDPDCGYLHNAHYQLSSFKSCSEEEISISAHENVSNNLLDEGDADGNIFNHSDSAVFGSSVFGSSAYKLLSQSTDDIRSDCMQKWVLKPYYRHGVFRRSSSVCSEPMLSSYRALSDADPDSCSMDVTDDDVKDAVEASHLIGESDEVMQETRHLIGVSHGSLQTTDHLIGGSTVLTTCQCNSCLQLLTADSSIVQHQLICTGT